jgi:hypothetical protein
MAPVLRWWFVFCASALGTLTAGAFGFLEALWKIDETKLSFVILVVYFGMSGFVGWLSVQARRATLPSATIVAHVDLCREASDLMMRLAIMGTTLGFFILVTSAFTGVMTAATISEIAKGPRHHLPGDVRRRCVLEPSEPAALQPALPDR